MKERRGGLRGQRPGRPAGAQPLRLRLRAGGGASGGARAGALGGRGARRRRRRARGVRARDARPGHVEARAARHPRMRFSSARVFPLALMFALALLTFYLERAVRVDEQHPSLRRHDPDYLLHNFTTTTYDRAGAAQPVLSAEKMVHYPDDDSTELTAPRMVQSRAPGARFTVTADRGVLSAGGDEIFLYGNVVLVREADALRPRTRVTTSFLHVLQERSLARTDEPVAIDEEHRAITGRGMEFNNETSEFLLHNDVRVRIEPGGSK